MVQLLTASLGADVCRPPIFQPSRRHSHLRNAGMQCAERSQEGASSRQHHWPRRTREWWRIPVSLHPRPIIGICGQQKCAPSMKEPQAKFLSSPRPSSWLHASMQQPMELQLWEYAAQGLAPSKLARVALLCFETSRKHEHHRPKPLQQRRRSLGPSSQLSPVPHQPQASKPPNWQCPRAWCTWPVPALAPTSAAGESLARISLDMTEPASP
mmetsp:Transcript_33042/g.52512  ORF Transcript_33042/g.52512 Transcript_33042/m.52512 type:complete len:212 (-) Transcript_33042:107-742(-)